MAINKGGYPTIIVVFIVGLIAVAVGFTTHPVVLYASAAIFGFLFMFVVFFFRDPDRNPPDNQSLIISPADGKVVLVEEIDEGTYLKSKATQISIFLSVSNVHVNRIPLTGTIEYAQYHPGKFLLAWDEKASFENERAEFGLKHENGYKIFFKQITGFLARRISYDIQANDQVKAGDRFGIMKFGSRMDVILPEGVDIKVKKGDTTRAGESVLAEIKA